MAAKRGRKAKADANSVSVTLTGAGAVLDDELSADDWDYQAALAQMDSETVLTVRRILPVNLKGHVGELAPAEFSAEAVRTRFGPGTYQIRARRPDEHGRPIFVAGGGTLTVAPTPGAQVASAPPGAPPVTDLAALLERMEERRRQEKAERNDFMLRWATVLTPILSPLVAKFGGGGGAAEVVTLVTKLRELDPPKPAEDRLETFLQALEYARKNDRGGGDDGWLGFAREALGAVAPVAQKMLSAPVAPRAGALPGQPAPTPAPAPAPAAAPVSPAVQTDDPMLLELLQYRAWFEATLAQLTREAAAHRNPELYAEVVLDHLPTGLTESRLAQILERPDWWAFVASMYPAAVPHERWFAHFHRAALQMLKAPPAPTVDDDLTAEAPDGT